MRTFPVARKLLAAAAPLTFAIATGCGHAAPPRVASIPAPVTAAAAPVAAVSATPIAVDLVSPELAATPMCDADGRPLAGNVRRKNARMCEAGVVTADLR